MKLFSSSSIIPPRLLISLAVRRSISTSSSAASLHEISNSFPSEADTIDTEPLTELKHSVENQNFQRPISEDRILTQTIVIRTLLTKTNDPISALDYYKWAEKNRGFASGSPDPLGVLLHILVKYPEHHPVVKYLLGNYVCSDSVPSANATVHRFVHCSKRFGFELNPRVFNYLLNICIRRRRYEYAVGCFRTMVSCGLMPGIPYTNNLLSALVEQSMLAEAHNLSEYVVSKKVIYNCETLNLMMSACKRTSKLEEAEKYFLLARDSRIELDGSIYKTAIQTACRKPDADFACCLLSEMQEKGLVVSGGIFTSVICACLKEGNIVKALMLKDEMIRSGHPMNLRLANNLMKGFYLHGDLNSALELFDMVKDKLSPNEVTYSVILEGCCRSGNIGKVQEIYTEMKQAGISANICVINSLIKGFLEARLMEEATKWFDAAIEAGIANVYTYNIFISWLCREGMMDKAYTVWDIMMDRGVEPTKTLYNNIILGNSKKGNMEVAMDLVSKMSQKNLKADDFTYGILIHGYFNVGESEKALGMFDRMMSLGIAPSDFTFNILIRGLCKFGRTAEAKDRMEKLFQMGFIQIAHNLSLTTL